MTKDILVTLNETECRMLVAGLGRLADEEPTDSPRRAQIAALAARLEREPS